MRGRRRRLVLGVVAVAASLLYLSHMFSGYIPAYDGGTVVRCVVASSVNDSHGHSTPTALNTEAKPKRILLVSYGRSGSTFTSYILSQAPGAFFFFEPLRPHVMRITGGVDVIMSYKAIGASFYKPRELNRTELSSYEQGALDVLRHVIDCNIQSLPVTDLMSSHLAAHGNTKTVASCLGALATDTYLNLPHYLQCLVDFWWTCKNSSVQIVKVIRLPLRSVFTLMRQDPHLQLVYLVRDPRATLLSQSSWFGHAPLTKDFCNMVADDVAHMRLLQNAFPERAITVRYEDIADDPHEWMRKLYQALGLTVTRDVVQGLRRMTSSSEDEGGFSAFRSNPRQAANYWRTEIDHYAVKVADRFCRGVYAELGYKLGTDFEGVVKNLSVPLTERTHSLATSL